MATDIVVYGTTWCPDCIVAKNVFKRRGIDYQWIDIDRDADARAYVERVNSGMRSVPTILFPDGSILVEPSSAELTEKLDESN
jgi:mycoredoxin